MTGPMGSVCLVLHAHLPYVKHDGPELTLEERWFYEAVTDSYLPLLDMMDRLMEDGIPFRMTFSLTSTLLAMMEDAVMRQKTLSHLDSLIRLAENETGRLHGKSPFEQTARRYAERFKRLRSRYLSYGCDLVAKFRSLAESGHVELLASSATHAFLPLLKTREALRAQLGAAVDEHKRLFGRKPHGLWLPECGYIPAADEVLNELGIEFIFVDTHGLPANRSFRPVLTPNGVAAFARDPESSQQVWSSQAGYPGHPRYREYYRDIGYDLGQQDEAEWHYIRPYLLPDGTRVATGLKYYRITEKASAEKQPYRFEKAAHQARRHAQHFLLSRKKQLQRAADPASVIVCPYDAELFGHWWFEGPLFLEALFRELASNGAPIRWTTPTESIRAYPPAETRTVSFSSWGRGGYADVWLQKKTDWMYPHLHRAEDRMIRAASEAASDASGEAHCSPSERRALNQAARELMLAQSSDWAFILDAGTVTAYARQRFREHLQRFHRLLDQWQSRQIDETELERLEKLSALLPRLSYEWFCANADKRSSANGSPTLPSKPPNTNPDRITVLMLAWEYPPRIIGGLARAVCDLSRHLAAKGHEVHVITCTVSGSPAYEAAEGVHVHRVPVLQSLRPVHFADWVFQMNVAFADYAAKLLERLSADILHAHDWLVCYAATEMQHSFRLPLVSTIHATEYGRNGGRIESPLQRRIHGLEQHLVRSSDQVITCSRAMHEEVRRVFRLPEANMHMIPNGIDLPAALEEERRPLQPHDRFMNLTGDAPFIFFIGRLVREKGVQVLLKAMPLVWQTFPETSLVIAGEGPMREKLQQLAAPMGDRIRFTGFLAQTEKQYFLRQAELCVIPSLYEPFGIVALEAMAAGTPVIVSATGGLAEIVEHEIDGLKASPGDHVSLARQIAGLLQNREQASKLRTNALRKVRERYDLCRIADATRQVYECALEKHRGIKTSERGIIK